jgi:type VI secretion system VasD/TssJ family lipoprotein
LRVSVAALFLSAFFLLSSCATREIPPPQWTYARKAVTITMKADSMLNLDQGKAHTLHVCIYQLKDPKVFNLLSEDRSGLYKLLDCTLFDASVTGSVKRVVHPDETLTLELDRNEESRYVAVAAGYYNIEKSRITRIAEIPVVTERRGFLWLKKTRRPGPLNLELLLGPQQIVTINPGK